MTKLWQQECRKANEKAKRDADAAEAQQKRAEEARKITISMDASLPKASRSKIGKLESLRGERVLVSVLCTLFCSGRPVCALPVFCSILRVGYYSTVFLRFLVGFTGCAAKERA